MSEAKELNGLRERIDAVDAQLLELISERARCAEEVAQVKRAAGADSDLYRPEREAQVLRRVQAENKGPLSDETVARLFREIMSACLALEAQLRIAFLGPEGTYTHGAVLKHFGRDTALAPMNSLPDVFREVESGSCQYGVVPIENSTEGMVSHTLDLFVQSPLKVCGEVLVRIHHHLLSTHDEVEQIKRVYAHQQALAQCRRWLDVNLPKAELIALSSNAEAARHVAGEDGAAAIAGDTAAELYGLKMLRRNIEDHPDNTTRFLVIGTQAVPPSGEDKTTVLVSTPNRPGALHRLLTPLALNSVSMTRIESRPSRCVNWEYVYFLDIEGHADAAEVKAALAGLRQESDLFRILGAYPRAVL
ncbi:prephenate dehydratase [Acidihalobacter ferrooxydans]|uniref:Bifunctional chorismate mutase/prephenate dehydratase n=1 Tax=Acidihalobacter ferrooxydans TaxID=1765967 RepID=A0A1P8ULF3_9GAMM|nr:prephenate dehydratase [Acidihalobacter ferrooxydans]APZ44584.1 chorismate mutase [Acidihalobacter ferrooxydans]